MVAADAVSQVLCFIFTRVRAANPQPLGTRTSSVPMFQVRKLRPRFLRPFTEPDWEFRLPGSPLQHLTSSLSLPPDHQPGTRSPPAIHQLCTGPAPHPLSSRPPTALQGQRQRQPGASLRADTLRTGEERANVDLPRRG